MRLATICIRDVSRNEVEGMRLKHETNISIISIISISSAVLFCCNYLVKVWKL